MNLVSSSSNLPVVLASSSAVRKKILSESFIPFIVDIPEFDAYRKAKLEIKVYEITGEIVCQDSTEDDGYIPLAEISGTAENPVVDVWHKGGYITAPQPTVINVIP